MGAINMTYNQIPKAQGLYHPEFEHDACGIGLYAHLKGHATHDIVKQGLKMLCQLDHRGGQGGSLTGDGAGLMVQIPDEYFRLECTEMNLPEKGRYGVGMLFFSNNDDERNEIEARLNAFIEQEGQTLLGWRTVPVDATKIGEVGKETCPMIRQVFIGASEEITDDLAFERKLFVIRKQAENWARERGNRFYFASLSSATIVYKGLLTPEQVDAFYLDLQQEIFRFCFRFSAFPLQYKYFS